MTTPYVGEIRIFGFPRIPSGWFACDGSLKPISQYETLYTVIGTAYGGDGISTFGVPDLRGQTPLHNGKGPGLTQRVLGEAAGTEGVTVLVNTMPSHSHPYVANTGQGSTQTPGPTVVLGAVGTDTMYLKTVVGASAEVFSSQAIGPMGGSTPHDNTMPTLTVSCCIAWAGVFPSQ